MGAGTYPRDCNCGHRADLHHNHCLWRGCPCQGYMTAAMADAEPPKTVAERRMELRKTIEEQVRVRLVEPWTTYLHDLELYQYMNARGIRVDDIPRLIERELKRQVPDEKK